LTIPIVAVVVWIIIVFAIFGGWAGACTNCTCNPSYCYTCADCVGSGWAQCMDMTSMQPYGYCDWDARDGSGSSSDNLQCFDDYSICYGGEMGSLMSGMNGDRCLSYDDGFDQSAGMTMDSDMMCMVMDMAAGSGYGSGYYGSGYGSATCSSWYAEGISYSLGDSTEYDSTKSIISSDCYTSVMQDSGAHGAGYCDDAHCDTCGYGPYAKGCSDCISCVKGYEIDVEWPDCTGRCVVKGTASNPLSTYSCSPTAQCAYDQMIAD